MDPNNQYDEISKEDNFSLIHFNVASSSIRPIINYYLTNGFTNNLDLVNPSSSPLAESVIVEYSQDENFSESNSVEVPLDSVTTSITLSSLTQNRRYWIRAKLYGSENFSSQFSIENSNVYKYLQVDSLSLSESNISNLLIRGSSTLLDSTKYFI